MKQYDAIIIGFGKGGKLLAAELANRNWKVAIIERSPQMYGGTCVNVGCIPTKALIYESEQAERLYRDDYGNQAKYYALAIRRKNKLVSFLRDKNHERIKEHPNITLYDGTASFVSDDTVKVVSHNKKEILLKGKEVFINTGATPILPAVKGIDASKHVFTSETLLQQSKLPGHLLILGAGAIGMTEEEAVKRGYSLQVSRLPAAAIPRARTLQQIDGMMKAIVNAHTGRIIGCTLFCIDAPEVINLVSLAMKNDLHYSILRDFIFTHPSMSEGLNDLFKAF